MNSLESQAPKTEAHFTDFQEKSKIAGNVALAWEKQCISFDTLMEHLVASEEKNFDTHCQLRDLELVDVNGCLELEVKTNQNGGIYFFGNHASNQLCSPNMLRLGTRMLTLGENEKERENINRLYIERFQAYRRNVGDHKQLFVRLRNDNGAISVRAMLSDNYTNIPHTFLAETLLGQIGGDGLVSHFDLERFNETSGDYCRYNVLIPDSMRAEEDSEYGGMQNVANSEVGTARYNMLPSLFRAICMNGCVWGERTDERFAISKVHKGKVNLDDLRDDIICKLQMAIPLIPVAIDRMIGLKALECESTLQLLGWLSTRELNWNKEQRQQLLLASGAEQLGNNAFSVVNALTRYAQQTDTMEHQQAVEETAGSYLEKWASDSGNWERVCNNSQQFDLAKELSTYAIGA